MHPLDAVRGFLTGAQIRDTAVTAALSGGADSVCLLACLRQLQEAYGLDLAAIHVQHGLRGEESLRDEAFCRELCARMGIPLTVVPVDVAAFRAVHHCGVEEAARTLRYAAFDDHVQGFCATAHTATDNLETMLFRLARGSGLRGLCGIPPQRGRYLRPLLTVTREEVETFLREQGLPFVTDSTNFQDAYTRSYLRQRVVPLLRRQNPSLDQTAVHTAELLRADEDFLASAAEAAYAQAKRPDGSLVGLSRLHPAMQRRCIRLFLEENGLRTDFGSVSAVERLLRTGGSAELVRGGMRACVSRDVLCLSLPQQETEQALHPGRNCLMPGYVLEAAVIPKKNISEFSRIHTMFANSALDYDIIKECAMLHGRKPGLRLRTAGRAHSVSVKKWLNTLDPAARQSVHYLSDAGGLLWVQGLGTAQHAAVSAQTQRMLVLCVHKAHT